MDEFMGGFILGALLIALIWLCVWDNTDVITTSVDGRFFIKTHNRVYELKDPLPVKTEKMTFVNEDM